MFLIRFSVPSALAALSRQARSLASSSLAVQLHDPVTDQQTATGKFSDTVPKIRSWFSRASFRAFLMSFGLRMAIDIVSGVARERKRTRPRSQTHVNVHEGSIAVFGRLYVVPRRDMCADLNLNPRSCRPRPLAQLRRLVGVSMAHSTAWPGGAHGCRWWMCA